MVYCMYCYADCLQLNTQKQIWTSLVWRWKQYDSGKGQQFVKGHLICTSINFYLKVSVPKVLKAFGLMEYSDLCKLVNAGQMNPGFVWHCISYTAEELSPAPELSTPPENNPSFVLWSASWPEQADSFTLVAGRTLLLSVFEEKRKKMKQKKTE